jgi:hypothetical protein
MERDEAIKRIRKALKKRSGKLWSVKGGRGTAWGWIKIDAPPARCRFDLDGTEYAPGEPGGYCMSPAERIELGKLLGLDAPVHHQGESIPSGGDYREEYVDRAEGRVPEKIGQPYWD